MEHFNENWMASTLSSPSDLIQMEFCANCCDCLDVKIEDSSCDFVNVPIDPSRIARCLSSIFRLNYLSSFIDPQPSSEPTSKSTRVVKTPEKTSEKQSLNWNGDSNVRLCDKCYSIFTYLWKFYEDFTQLTNLESRLAQQIQKLDNCIQDYKISRTSSEIHDKPPSGSSLSSDCKGPFIVLKRLETDPEAQKAIQLSNQSKESRLKRKSVQKSTEISIKEADDVVDNHHDDNDFTFTPPASPAADPSDSDDGEEDDAQVDNEEDSDDSDDYDEEPKTKKRKKQEPASKEKGKTKNNNSHNKKSSSSRSTSEENRRRILQLRRYRKRKLTQPNPCWLCETNFSTQKECYDHTKREHCKSDSIICKSCAYVTNNDLCFKMHEKICKDLMPGKISSGYQCPECPRTFCTKDARKNHMDNVHNERELLHCDEEGCKFQTKFAKSLKQHINIQHQRVTIPEDVRTCYECGRVFKTIYSYKYHHKSQHTEEGAKKHRQREEIVKKRRAEAPKQPGPKQSTICEQCQVEMFTPHALRVHERKFHPDTVLLRAKFVCDDCGAVFSSRVTFKKHMTYTHSDAREFVCNFCGKKFKSSNHLEAHIKNIHDEQGRQQYKVKYYERKERKKIRDEALAQVLAMKDQTVSTQDEQEN